MTYHPLQLAEAFLQTGELDDALDTLNTYLEQDQDDLEAHRLRAAILIRFTDQKHLEIALKDLSRLSDQKSADEIMHLATIHERLGNTEQALSILQNAHLDNPNDSRLTERLLITLRSQGHLKQAYQLILTQQNDDWRWQGWAGEIAADLNQFDAAIRHFSAALTQLETKISHSQQHDSRNMLQMAHLGNYARLVLMRGRVYETLNEHSSAANDYAKAAIWLPNDPTIPLKQGIIAWKQVDHETALNFCQRAFSQATVTMHQHMLEMLEDHTDLMQDLQANGIIP